jgi:N-methylhydantoinase A
LPRRAPAHEVVEHELDEHAFLQVAVDIGGTFTDVVLFGRDVLHKAKVLSTPPDYERGVIAGIEAVLDAHGAHPGAITAVFNGMTIATNAMLEDRGAATALVTTKGFRDALELGRGRRPSTSMYDLLFQKPAPLVRRRDRFEVDQRITAAGELAPPVTPAAIDDVAQRIEAAEVESVAVSLINSFLRPEEEIGLTEQLRDRFPELHFTCSVDVAPELGEYERTSTAVVNAYLAPVVQRYLEALDDEFERRAIDAPFYVMQSNGGLARSGDVRKRPVQVLESGPAAGVIATRELVRETGATNAIAFDMGGTTAKATLIEDGEASETSTYEVGAGMHARRGLNMGAGHTVLISTLDIAEIGAGGGSIFWIDAGGAPRVGPRSAGASPGPACYGAGGEDPTLSDAVLVLGYINPTSIAGGTQLLRRDLAEAALAPLAEHLDLSVVEAAYGAYRIAVANMTRLLRAVTIERGRDPRNSVLVAFGGAGPAYAATLARELDIGQVVVPVAPGLFSAVGLLASNPQYDDVRRSLGRGLDLASVNDTFDEMERAMLTQLLADGYAADEITLTRNADMHYRGQTGILKIPVAAGVLREQDLEDLRDRLDDEHLRTYGHHRARESAQIENLRVRAVCQSRGRRSGPLPALAAAERAGAGRETASARTSYFGPDVGAVTTPVLRRSDLDGSPRQGPLIVEEMDSTIVVPPFADARLDDLANVVLTVK